MKNNIEQNKRMQEFFNEKENLIRKKRRATDAHQQQVPHTQQTQRRTEEYHRAVARRVCVPAAVYRFRLRPAEVSE